MVQGSAIDDYIISSLLKLGIMSVYILSLIHIFVALISIAIGFIFSAKKPRDFTFYLKEGCATTALGWIVLSKMCIRDSR